MLAARIVMAVELMLIVALLVEIGRRRADRRDAEASRHRVENEHSAILRALPDLMFVIGADGTYLDYHVRDIGELFAPPEKFIGQNVRDIIPAPLAGRMMAAIESALRTGDTVVVDYDLPMAEGARFYEARIVACGADRTISIVRDTTEAMRAQERNRVLAGRLITAQEAERRRIARELHDDVGQRAALVKIGLDQIAADADVPSGVKARLKDIAENAGTLASDLSRMAHQLHPSSLRNLGLERALSSLCVEASKQHGLDAAFTCRAPTESIRDEVSLCVFRIAQEALHNVVRHSGARRVSVLLDGGADSLALTLTDDGAGFDPSRTDANGLGLVSMRERVALLGGTLEVESTPGQGTRVAASVPLHPEAPCV